MNKTIRSFIAAVLMLGLSPYAIADSVIEVFPCEIRIDAPEEFDIDVLAADWLAAARKLESGAELNLYLTWPMVATENDNVFHWVLQAPDIQAWAAFMAEYGESEELAALDEAFYEQISCSGNSIWYSDEVE